MSDRRGDGPWDDPLDEIDFEEFELNEPASWEDVDDYQPHESHAALINCPSCGAGQNAANRHCEQCGARLGRQTVAVASPPLRSATAGGRALGIMVVVIALVILAALVIPAIRGGDDVPDVEGAVASSTSAPTVTTVALGPINEITPISISCSSEYSASLGCGNLIDGEDTYWNDSSLRGEETRITVTFVNPVALEQVQIINVQDEEKFRRNYRVRGVEIYSDDMPGVPFVDEIPDENDRPHGVETPTNTTYELEIRVTSTWSSEALAGQQAFDELAIEEIKFWGRIADSNPLESNSTAG